MLGQGLSLNEHLNAFAQGITEAFGPAEEPNKYLGTSIHGWMDSVIVEKMIEKCGFEATPENKQKGMISVESVYKKTAIMHPEVLPGVVRVLKHLATLPNVTFGIASGNFPGIAWKKLELAGIAELFPLKTGGFGTSGSRAECVSNGIKSAENIVGHKFDKTIHIGDTVNDIDAAHKAGSIAIAVLTGTGKRDDFPSPDYIFENLDVCFDQLMQIINE